jgi:mRNA export factor
MDVQFPLMVVGTAERHVMIYNLNNPSVVYKQKESPLKWQTRVVSCFNAANGFAIGSIEGRVGIQYIEDKDSANIFSFKCHRDDKNVYSVNAISFHPTFGTFSTAGADGNFVFWDKDSKQRLKSFPQVGGPISCTGFNRNGSIFAYSVSYDWSKGHEHYPAGTPNKIFLMPVKEEDVKPRAKNGKR